MTKNPLPAKFDSFGPKTVKAKATIQGMAHTDEVDVIYFFPKDGHENPGGTDPNWYYYGSQFVDKGRIKTLSYNPNLAFYGSTYPDTRVAEVGSLAGGYNDETGHTGIQSFYETLVHESCHIDIWEERWGVGGSRNSTDDTDGDFVPDAWETSAIGREYLFEVGKDDTYRSDEEGESADYKYQEAVCREKEHEANETKYDEVDWSEGGKIWTALQ